MPVQANDLLAAFWGRGYDGQRFSEGQAGIRFWAAQDWTPAAHGTYITFYTTPLNAIGIQERMRITEAGNVGIGTSSPSAKLHVYNPAGTNLLRIAQFENAQNAANNNGVLISIARGGTNTDAYALDVQTGGGLSAICAVRWTGGDWHYKSPSSSGYCRGIDVGRWNCTISFNSC
jgi:hypothetical protein